MDSLSRRRTLSGMVGLRVRWKAHPAVNAGTTCTGELRTLVPNAIRNVAASTAALMLCAVLGAGQCLAAHSAPARKSVPAPVRVASERIAAAKAKPPISASAAAAACSIREALRLIRDIEQPRVSVAAVGRRVIVDGFVASKKERDAIIKAALQAAPNTDLDFILNVLKP